MFRVSLDHQGVIKLAKMSEKPTRKKKTNTDKKKMNEDTGKRESIRPRMLFPVKKMTSLISGVFRCKETLAADKNRAHRDHSAPDETLIVGKVQIKQKPLQKKKESFWESARIRLKILILGQRLKTRRRRRRKRSLNVGEEEEELSKKRILMGERCKPINKSGVLHYDANGILLSEP